MEIRQANYDRKTAIVVPIETTYRGYRFRSRLEARWAMALDLLGIKWRYEVEGFTVTMPDGSTRRYLPDFWLTKLEAFLEVKPNRKASQAVWPVLQALSATSGHPVLLIAGTPDINQPATMVLFVDGEANHTRLRECVFCGAITLAAIRSCDCTPRIIVTKSPQGSARINRALAEAQRARFEHGETLRSHPVATRGTWFSPRRVYMAGPVLETVMQLEDGEPCRWDRVVHWRVDCLNVQGDHKRRMVELGHRSGTTIYAGPEIIEDHGIGCEGLAVDCLSQVNSADVVFGGIDRVDTIGTIAELGAAHALGKPILIAFASEELHDRFYFVQQLARVSVIAGDVKDAWCALGKWCP